MKNKDCSNRNIVGYVLCGLTGIGAVGLLTLSYPFIVPAFRKICLPYVPATNEQITNVLTFIKRSRGKTLIDLGSGDGRIVIEAAKLGYKCVGVELNPWLVLYSRIRALYVGCNQNAKFLRQDLFKTNLSKYDKIVIFGVDEMMPILEKKLDNELIKDGTVIACRFPLPNWDPVHIIVGGIDSVWMYNKPIARG